MPLQRRAALIPYGLTEEERDLFLTSFSKHVRIYEMPNAAISSEGAQSSFIKTGIV
jgi:hypothetical protein